MTEPKGPMSDSERDMRFQMRVTGILDCFKFYGMNIYIPGAVEQIKEVAKKLFVDGERV